MKHMMDHQPVNKSLVIRYFGGLCTPEERAQVDAWLQQEGNEMLMQQWLWEDWQATTGTMPEATARQLKENLSVQMGRKAAVVPIKRPVFYRVAAAVVLLMVLAGALLLQQNKLHTGAGEQAIVYNDSIQNNGLLPFKATLADGSTVWLNAGAVLYVANDFGRSTRRVKLKGEAFFDIQANAAQPFYTEAAGLTTQVLGTSYNIEAYPAEKEIHVSLVSGSVVVRSADTACWLKPGEMVSYAKDWNTMQASAVATTDPSAWIKGKIVFNRIALPEALDRLSRFYHTPIRYNREHIKDKYITGEFDRQALAEVLQPMLFVHNLQYKLLTNGAYQVH